MDKATKCLKRIFACRPVIIGISVLILAAVPGFPVRASAQAPLYLTVGESPGADAATIQQAINIATQQGARRVQIWVHSPWRHAGFVAANFESIHISYSPTLPILVTGTATFNNCGEAQMVGGKYGDLVQFNQCRRVKFSGGAITGGLSVDSCQNVHLATITSTESGSPGIVIQNCMPTPRQQLSAGMPESLPPSAAVTMTDIVLKNIDAPAAIRINNANVYFLGSVLENLTGRALDISGGSVVKIGGPFIRNVVNHAIFIDNSDVWIGTPKVIRVKSGNNPGRGIEVRSTPTPRAVVRIDGGEYNSIEETGIIFFGGRGRIDCGQIITAQNGMVLIGGFQGEIVGGVISKTKDLGLVLVDSPDRIKISKLVVRNGARSGIALLNNNRVEMENVTVRYFADAQFPGPVGSIILADTNASLKNVQIIDTDAFPGLGIIGNSQVQVNGCLIRKSLGAGVEVTGNGARLSGQLKSNFNYEEGILLRNGSQANLSGVNLWNNAGGNIRMEGGSRLRTEGGELKRLTSVIRSANAKMGFNTRPKDFNDTDVFITGASVFDAVGTSFIYDGVQQGVLVDSSANVSLSEGRITIKGGTGVRVRSVGSADISKMRLKFANIGVHVESGGSARVTQCSFNSMRIGIRADPGSIVSQSDNRFGKGVRTPVEGQTQN